MSNYARELYQIKGVAGTVNFEHIKTRYHASHLNIDPTGVVPVSPLQVFTTEQNRTAHNR